MSTSTVYTSVKFAFATGIFLSGLMKVRTRPTQKATAPFRKLMPKTNRADFNLYGAPTSPASTLT
jgi:hypothetical protein